ncbi:hypothetical protein BDV93DRAFT_522884 [Ceratobasidium sp. AG-I]|nr:hypothetical protein BDV93DRAFT_522884 [Ceratobasidium sp. AG-I]
MANCNQSSESISTSTSQHNSDQADNAKQPINSLPSELLSRIFAVGDEEQRSERLKNTRYSGLQDIAIQVCRHWRNVAIDSPALWTYIHISKAPSLGGKHVLLYLARSGPTTPLVIDIEMRTRYLHSLADVTLEKEVNSAREILDFLVSHGATTDRWSALFFCAKTSSVLFEVVSFLNAKSAPALQLLSLWWKSWMAFDSDAQEHDSLSRPALSVWDRTIFSSQVPQLRSLDLNMLPIFYEVNHSPPLITSLTHLKLIASLNPYPLPKLHALLSSNLQLQSLTLSAGLTGRFDSELTTSRIHLPFLRSFSLDFKSCWRWAWGIIDMIDAPTVEHLHLALSLDSEMIVELVNRMTTGVSKDRFASISQALFDGQSIPYRSIYPLLRHLVIESNSAIPDMFKPLLAIFPTITRVSLPDLALPLLAAAPWVLPNLEYISTEMPSVLSSVLHSRARAGFFVKKIEITDGPLRTFDWPKPIEVVQRHVSPHASDSDDYDETDCYYGAMIFD